MCLGYLGGRWFTSSNRPVSDHVYWKMCRFTTCYRPDREAVALILDTLPHDPTLSEENLFAAIFSDQIGEVIKCANEIDIWLVAHLADMMHSLGLLVESEE